MGLSINTNITAVETSRQTNKATQGLGASLRQMASGLRINKAADDASGLAVAETLRASLRQGQMEINNLQSGINYAQTADSGLAVQQQAVQRLGELATQAANGTLSDSQRSAINTEAQQLTQQLNDVAQNTQYNGQAMLKQNTTVDLGASGPQVSVTASTTASLGMTTLDMSTAAGAQSAMAQVATAQSQLDQNRANLGAQVNGFESAISQRQTSTENAAAAESLIRDADLARTSINRTRNEVLQQSGLAATIQSNVTQRSALALLRG